MNSEHKHPRTELIELRMSSLRGEISEEQAEHALDIAEQIWRFSDYEDLWWTIHDFAHNKRLHPLLMSRILKYAEATPYMGWEAFMTASCLVSSGATIPDEVKKALESSMNYLIDLQYQTDKDTKLTEMRAFLVSIEHEHR